MTDEELERQSAVEQEALKMLNIALKEGRRTPRRHQRFALAIVLPIFVVVLLLLIWIFQ
jgi:t-SNARE complex subunit (syntaxin)